MIGTELLEIEPGVADAKIEEAPDLRAAEPLAPDEQDLADSRFPPEPAQNVRKRFQTYEVQWRYLGDRISADAAYCLRFGVAQPPEPSSLPDSVWAYALPDGQPKR